MPATTRSGTNRGGSAGRGRRGGKSAPAPASSKRPKATKRKAPVRPPTPSPDEEEEEEESFHADEDDVDDIEDIIDIPSPSSGKRMTAKEQERRMKMFQKEFTESRRQDARNPSIKVTGISHSAWPSIQSNLDLKDANWKTWSNTLFDIVQSTPPLSLHLAEVPSPPDPSLQPNAFNNWQLNDGVVIAQIRLHVSPPERDFIDKAKFKTARQLYDILKTRHTKLGLSAQVSLINDALNLPFSSKTRVSDTLKELADLNDRIWQIGQPTADDFLSILVLHNIRSIRDLHRDIENGLATIPDYGVSDITKRLALYESVHQKTLPTSDPLVSTVNLASSRQQRPQPHKSHLHCDNCHKGGHTHPYCTKPGGGCEGYSLEQVLAKKNFDLAMNKKPSKSASNTTTTTNPTTASSSIQTAQIASIEEVTNITTLHTDPLYSLVEASMTEADRVEYNDAWLTTMDLKVGVDWGKFRRPATSGDAFIARPVLGRRFNAILDILTWFIDTCASVHVSHERSDFFELRPLSSPHVVRGIGGSLITAVGIGSIRLKLAKGAILVLHDVLFIPEASARLISVSRLLESTNWHAVITKSSASLRNPSGAVMATGSLHAGRHIYKLDISRAEVARPRSSKEADDVDSVLIASRIPTLDTWHRRLGHANNKSVLDLATKGLATGMDIDLSTLPPDCDACKKGKQKRTPVPSVRQGEKATEPLHTIYVDLTGPHMKSASGNCYSLDIVDDSSGKPWAIPTKTKGQALDLLQTWIAQVTTSTKRTLRRVRIDNGELKSARFNQFCAERGITLEYTAPYTSAHNGRVERLHQTLMSKARTMSECNNFPPNRWDELYVTAAYLHARTPSASSIATPYELFYGRKPDLSHLREIGSRAFVLIQPQKDNPKIKATSFECLLIGYSQTAKAYRLYHRPTHRVIESYHVSFIERKDDISIPFRPGQAVHAPSAADPSLSILPNPPVSTLHTDKTAQSPSDLVLPPLVSSPKRVSKPSEKVRAMQTAPSDSGKHSAALADLSSYLSQLEAGCSDAEADLAQAFDAMAASLDLEGDDNPPSPGDPETMKEALAGQDRDKWMESMKEELDSIKQLGVYRLVPRSAVPPDRKVLRGKFVYRRKFGADGAVSRYKSRYVFGGHRQVPGRDYDRTTAPTARMEAFRTLLSFAASKDYDAQQFDVKTAFLNGVLSDDEKQYMEQPKGFEEPGKEDWVWELCRGLYGMKQAGRIWNKTLNEAMQGWMFKRLPCEWCIYYRRTEKGIVIVAIHVDDFLSIASSREANEEFKQQLKARFEISEGDVDLCLGLRIERDRAARTVFLSQPALIDQVVANFGQSDAYPVTTPMVEGASNILKRPDSNEVLSEEEKSDLTRLPYRSLIGSLMYIAIGTRPDIAFAVSKLSQFLDCFRRVHWQAALRVVQYLKGTRNLRLLLGGSSFTLVGFSDSSWAEEETRRSHMGYCYSVGSGMISWSSKRQATVAGSSTEAEYIAASEASREAVWLRSLLRELELLPNAATSVYTKGDFDPHATTVFCDNISKFGKARFFQTGPFRW
jgi:hypothetical protein